MKRLRAALEADPCPEKDTQWTIYLEVQPSVATFRFNYKALQYPIDGKSVGYAEFPEHAIWDTTRWLLERTYPKEVTVVVYGGGLRCHDATSTREIQIGYMRDPKRGRIIYTTEGELVALGQMLDDPSVLHPDLPRRINEAADSVAGDIYRAAAMLREAAVTDEDISHLVDTKISALKPSVRTKFDFLESALWKS